MKKVDWTFCWECGARPGEECDDQCPDNPNYEEQEDE